jgi:hypothetical protein
MAVRYAPYKTLSGLFTVAVAARLAVTSAANRHPLRSLRAGQPERVQRLKESNVTAKYFFTIKEVNPFFATPEICLFLATPEICPPGRRPRVMCYR